MIRRIEQAHPYLLSLFRIVTGFLFACHGLASLFGLFGEREASPTAWPGGIAALIQLIGGILVMVGLGTRLAALISSGSMAYAYFDVHQQHGVLPIQNHGEPAAMFAWTMLLLVFTGPGPLALDRFFHRRRTDHGAQVDERQRGRVWWRPPERTEVGRSPELAGPPSGER